MINPEVAIPLAVFIAMPLTLAFRWIQHRERMAEIKAGRTPAAAAEDAERLARLERAVESIALEVERVGEGQRYLTRVFAERPLAAPAPLPAPLPVARPQTNTPH